MPAVVAVVAMVASRWTGTATAAAWCVAWTAAGLCALAGMVRARRTDRGGATRWSYWIAATGSWLAGQLAWDVYAVTGAAHSPNVADAGWWGFAVLVMAGLLRPVRGSGAVRLVLFFEALPVAAAATALTSAWLWSDVAASPLPALARASALVYPLVYVTAAVLTLHELLASPLLRRLHGAGPALMLAGVVAEAAGFVVWSKQLLADDYVPGATAIDSLWVIGLVAIGIGGALCTTRPAREVPAGEEPSRRGGVLPAATFLLLIAALVSAQVGHAGLGSRLALAVGLFICGTTLIMRGALLQRRLRILLARERSARREIAARETELARANDRLAEDVRRDGLTGLLNRRALAEDLPELDAATGRDGARFAFALCDVDHFKAYNDCLGHLAGDQALRDVSAIIRAELRAGDGAYRYGGEEILIVLRGLDAQAALAAAERVRQAVSAAAIPHPDGIGGVLTLSCGVASGSADAATVLARADAALYLAKDAGRNGAAAATADLPPVWSSRPRPRSFADPVLRHLRGVLEVSRAAAAGDVIAVTEALAANIRRELRFRTVAVNLLDATGTEAAVVAVVGDADAREPLLLPLRAATGELIGVVSVDEPDTGLRPDDAALEVLMTVASHGALAIEQAQRAAGRRPGAVLVR